MKQITELVNLVFEDLKCSECGVTFYVPDHWIARRRQDGATFYCPNGHSQYFCESTQKKLDLAQLALSRAQSQLHLERDQRIAAEEARDRLKKRISKGVCPCCKRTVSQLQRHMESKHPNWPQS